MSIMNCIINRYILSIVALALSVSVQSQTLGFSGENRSSVGIYIKDLRTGKVVYSQDAQKLFMPASVAKVVTSASAMSFLSDDFKYETVVRLRGVRCDDIWKGDLEVIASGDPTLESEYFTSNCGMTDSIAASLKTMGITRITGSIRLIDDDTPEQGPVDTWQINDVAYNYGVGWYAFNWKDNNKSISRMAKPYPWSAFEKSLRNSLRDNDISVGQRLVCSSDEDADENESVETVYSGQSPSRNAILASMMCRSDNMYAEGILRSFAPGEKREVALEKERDLWKGRGIDFTYSAILDGSGLSRTNRLSPKMIGDILEYMSSSKDSTGYIRMLPVSGVSGTMRSFMSDTPLKGRLALKTGSVNNVQCYAGYVIDNETTCHPTHIVVIMVNSFYCPRKQLKAAVEKFLLKQLRTSI